MFFSKSKTSQRCTKDGTLKIKFDPWPDPSGQGQGRIGPKTI